MGIIIKDLGLLINAMLIATPPAFQNGAVW